MTTVRLTRIDNPAKSAWDEICRRPALKADSLFPAVQKIIEDVRKGGDRSLLAYTKRFDGVALDHPAVTPEEVDRADAQIDGALKEAIALAAANIRAFHTTQKEVVHPTETTRGVTCWRKSVPLQSVGLYIPGGTAPLFSTLLMLAIPAQIAGCPEIVVCTPPRKDGSVHPAILYTAGLLGIRRVFKAGGAQAVASMALGTESIPVVNKIFGPGNQYVTAAKQLLSIEANVPFDLPAGPTELLIIADHTASPTFLAADILSQAEHGVDSQIIVATTAPSKLNELDSELEEQLSVLPRREIAAQSLNNSAVVIFNDTSAAIEFSNRYAPEHLIIATEDAGELAETVTAAGSVFIGHWSPESVGDYASGTNHTLPTNGAAHAYSGVSLDSFFKKITFQNLTREGLNNIGPAVEVMAEAEELVGHARAVLHRRKSMESHNREGS